MVDYEVTKAHLHVEHPHPQDADDKPSTAVEINHVVATIKSTELQAGSWLNVIGYVRRSRSPKNKRKRMADAFVTSQPQVLVQAVLIWNAGAIKIADYERTLAHQQELEKLAAVAVPKQ